jgi:hypothetical protein
VEAEIGALFLNAKEGVNIRNILKEMGHPQPATPMQNSENSPQYIPAQKDSARVC